MQTLGPHPDLPQQEPGAWSSRGLRLENPPPERPETVPELGDGLSLQGHCARKTPLCQVGFPREGMKEVLDWSEEKGKNLPASLRPRLNLAGTLHMAALNAILGQVD